MARKGALHLCSRRGTWTGESTLSIAGSNYPCSRCYSRYTTTFFTSLSMVLVRSPQEIRRSSSSPSNELPNLVSLVYLTTAMMKRPSMYLVQQLPPRISRRLVAQTRVLSTFKTNFAIGASHTHIQLRIFIGFNLERFGGVPWSQIRRKEMCDWLYWSLYYERLHDLDKIPPAQLKVLLDCLDLIEKRTGTKFPEGSNRSV